MVSLALMPSVQKLHSYQANIVRKPAPVGKPVDFREEVVDDLGGWFLQGPAYRLEETGGAKFLVVRAIDLEEPVGEEDDEIARGDVALAGI